MQTFKADITSYYMQGPVDHWTYVYAVDADDARRRLEREGYEVRKVEPVKLTHLGGEVA